MVLAVVGFSIASFLAYQWLTQPILTSTDVTQFPGAVKEVREYSSKSAYLEITLENQPHAFRCFSPLYPSAFTFDLHGRLGIGALISLGVATSEVSAPRRNWVQNQQFFKFITMSIGSDEVLSLDGHNKSVESNKKIGPWLCLMMAVLCVWLFLLGYRHRVSSGSIIEILKARKNEAQA